MNYQSFMRKYSISLDIKEMKTKTALRFHVTLIGMVIIKNKKKARVIRWSKKTLYTLLVGAQIRTVNMETGIVVLQKPNSQATI